MKKLISLFALILSICTICNAEPIISSGQISAWAVSSSENPPQAGMRYIPDFQYIHALENGGSLNFDAALNLNTYAPLDSLKSVKQNADSKPYRATMTYSADNFEVRAGLQKITFGPGKILRSLRWFDQIDYRDPLQLTNGVYSVLARRYFKNNSNLWMWGLYGNNNLVGLETFKTNYNTAEFGGRYQHHMHKGEVGLSYHQRQVSPSSWNSTMTTPMTNGLDTRYGLDGFWDLGVGFWFEASADKIRANSTSALWQEYLTVGTDYTFNIGPGVHVMYEHFINSQGPQARTNQANLYQLSALECDFSLNLIDKLTAVMYYDWIGQKSYPYLNLQRTYDDWQYNLMGFLTQKTNDITFSGSGVMFQVTYNY